MIQNIFIGVSVIGCISLLIWLFRMSKHYGAREINQYVEQLLERECGKSTLRATFFFRNIGEGKKYINIHQKLRSIYTYP